MTRPHAASAPASAHSSEWRHSTLAGDNSVYEPADVPRRARLPGRPASYRPKLPPTATTPHRLGRLMYLRSRFSSFPCPRAADLGEIAEVKPPGPAGPGGAM